MNRNTQLSLLALLAAYSLSAAEPARPAVIGHRGMLQAAPENTLAAFSACLALRVGFEFDVRRNRDGTLICLHDETVDRTTTGTGRLADWTGAKMRELDAGLRFAPEFRGERVPTIDEIFALAAGSPIPAPLLAVDLKEVGNGLEAEIVQAAERRHLLDRLIFIGLTIESPTVRSALRAASRKSLTARLAADEPAIADVLADKDADWVYVRFLPSAEAIARIHAAGKRIFIAGPLVAGHEAANWKRAAKLGFDAVLTDFPLELARQLRATKP